jgi:hypothetical protein
VSNERSTIVGRQSIANKYDLLFTRNVVGCFFGKENLMVPITLALSPQNYWIYSVIVLTTTTIGSIMP